MRTVNNMKSENAILGLALFYISVGRKFIDAYGTAGDAAVRSALVDYAVGRGTRLKHIHQSLGMKTNLYNFSHYQVDGYGEGSYAEGTFSNVTKYRDSHDTIRCSFVNEMIKRGERELAVTYCEEVHPPLWQAYAPTAIVNLGKTLSQEGSNRCLFDVFLRPGRMSDQQRKECFEEYDPDFKGDRRDCYKCPDSRESAMIQFMFMFNAYYKVAKSDFNDKAVGLILEAIPGFLQEYANALKESAREFDLEFDAEFIDSNSLFAREIETDIIWNEGLPEVKQYAKEYIYEPYNKMMGR